MAEKKWWEGVKHRREELVQAMMDIKAWTNDPQSKYAVEELLAKL
jgi:hypothetical protein